MKILTFKVFLVVLQLFLISFGQSPDIINWRFYQGHYSASQLGPTFDYLDGKQGKVILIFYGQPNKDIINCVDIFFLDPNYIDSKVVFFEIKGVINFTMNGSWTNNSHNAAYTKLWKQRQEDSYDIGNVSTEFKLKGLQTQDFQQVQIQISIKGNNFQIIGALTYFDQVLASLSYALFAAGLVGIQIYCGFKMLKIMSVPNFVFCSKISLLTLSLCCIQDFSQTMGYIQNIMTTESGYLFFIIPALSFIILFIIFDMKMVFLVWRCNNLRSLDNPQLLRRKLTAFYIQFYLGLFIYLTLTYFFNNDQWFIVLRYLILIPQIIHNVKLGNNPGFNPYYLLGFIGTRLMFPLYQRICPSNRYLLTPMVPLAISILGIYCLQLLLLYLQYRLGSRFFVPKRFQPNYYNYRLKLIADQTNRQLQCTICLQGIFQKNDQSVQSDSIGSIVIPLMHETTVMNAPCGHKFHEQCLKQWMQVKLQCPTCRADLPSL